MKESTDRMTVTLKTIGDIWHEEAEHESPIAAFVTLMLAFALVLGVVVMFAEVEEADAKTMAASASVNGEIRKAEKTIKFAKTKVKIAKAEMRAYAPWKSYLTRTQRESYKSNVKRLLKAGDKKTVKVRRAKCHGLVIFAQHKADVKKTADAAYSKWRGNLTTAQDKSFKSNILHIMGASTAGEVDSWWGKCDPLMARASLCTRIDARGYSDAKVRYVTAWGPRIDSYLRGSAMAGTGYVIAKSAYDHKTDPRIYPAIAAIESGKGAAPYGCKYNVCGWVWNPPAMYSWEDAADKWHSYFSRFFSGETYPLQSMHGYGGYGPSYVNAEMAKI